MSVFVRTDSGTLGIASSRGECAICGRETDAAEGLQIDSYASSTDSRAVLTVCGNCVAKALSIALGASHVQHGGRLEDLTAGQMTVDDFPELWT